MHRTHNIHQSGMWYTLVISALISIGRKTLSFRLARVTLVSVVVVVVLFSFFKKDFIR